MKILYLLFLIAIYDCLSLINNSVNKVNINKEKSLLNLLNNIKGRNSKDEIELTSKIENLINDLEIDGGFSTPIRNQALL